MIRECSNTLEELVDILKISHRREIMDLLTIKKGYDVRVNKVGKKHTDKILEESIKKKLRNNKLWDVIEMLKTLKGMELSWNIKY